MRPLLAACCTLAAVSPYLQAQQPASVRAPRALSEPSSLPITRVALYKNGVGFFEHTGRVTGDQAVTIDFTSSQLNDVLQSLTAIDLNGGRIAGAGYNSTTPLDQQLKTLPLALSTDPSDVDFYNAVRGARVQVTAPGASIQGRLLAIDLRANSRKPTPGDDTEAGDHRFLTVVADSGQVRTLELTPATTVTLLDTALHTDVTRYLELLAANRSEGLRHLTLTDRGTGSRELRVSYISEVPVWKSTYRILFTSAAGASTGNVNDATMQGWSVVDNTTGSDWINVHLDLIAGAPQSFIQPLSTPLYARRPEIAIAEQAQLTPQTFESGIVKQNSLSTSAEGNTISGHIEDPTGAIIPNASVFAVNEDTNASISARTDGNGNFTLRTPGPGRYRVTATSPGFQQLTQENVSVNNSQGANLGLQLNVGSSSQTVSVEAAPMADLLAYKSGVAGGVAGISVGRGSGIGPGSAGNIGGGVSRINGAEYDQLAQASIIPNSTTNAFDDFFEYTLTDPITIRKNESALVPILQTRLPVERVSLWSVQQPTTFRALWLTNSSTLTLDRGSFSIVENGSFGGEGLLDPIHPGEKRLLSYAADQAVHVSTDHTNNTRRVTHLKIADGVLTETSTDIQEVEYAIRNAAPDPRTVLIEQPILQGWTLDSDPKPAETTATVYRFRVATKPSEIAHLHIGQRRTNFEYIRLVDRTEDQLTLLLQNAKASPATLAALQPAFDAHNKVVQLDSQIRTRQSEINDISTDQTRLRQNLQALKGTPEEKALATRYTGELNTQEDRLATLRKEIADLQTQRQAADSDFNQKLAAIHIDETL